MNNGFSLNTPLTSIFIPKENSVVKQTLLILAGVFLMALASQLSIPLNPVSLTFQSATVVLIGMAFGARNGVYVMAAYIIAGLLGAPVFADFGFGFAKLLGPSGGYLIGFVPAAFVSGYLAEKGWGKNILSSFAAACAGASVIFIFGLPMLATYVGWHNTYLFGVLPFIVTEPIKLIFISLLAPKFWKTN